jgi:hypothetical protein
MLSFVYVECHKSALYSACLFKLNVVLLNIAMPNVVVPTETIALKRRNLQNF